jgi:hypothetical protein
MHNHRLGSFRQTVCSIGNVAYDILKEKPSQKANAKDLIDYGEKPNGCAAAEFSARPYRTLAGGL